MNPIFLLVALSLLSAPAFAKEAQRASESDMFGGDSIVSKTPTPTKTPRAGQPSTQDEEGMGSSAKPGTGKSEETLQIGGTFSSEADFYIQENVPFLDNTASNPNILFLYLDSKLENDSRVFA